MRSATILIPKGSVPPFTLGDPAELTGPLGTVRGHVVAIDKPRSPFPPIAGIVDPMSRFVMVTVVGDG